MLKTSNLAQQLKEQISQENEIIQSLIKQQQSDMRNELNAIYQQELSIMQADIKRQSKSLGWKSVSNRVIWPLTIGISLSIGIFGGSWATMQYLVSEISSNYVVISQQTEKMKKLEPFNIEALSKDKVNYLVLPKGAKVIDKYQSQENKTVIKWEQ